MDHLLLVLSNPRDGRHDDFNDWYSHVHVRDVMRLPGSSAVQRLRLAPDGVIQAVGIVPDRQFDYLAIYECHDRERVSADHGAVFTPMMLISDSFDFTMREPVTAPICTARSRRLRSMAARLYPGTPRPARGALGRGAGACGAGRSGYAGFPEGVTD